MNRLTESKFGDAFVARYPARDWKQPLNHNKKHGRLMHGRCGVLPRRRPAGSPGLNRIE